MKPSHPHEIYSEDADVYLITGEDKVRTFRQIVEQSQFLSHIGERWESSGKAREEYLIGIKPNIMTASIYEENSPVYTDPQLVEELIVILKQEGFRRFVVVESQNVYNYSYKNRRVSEVAEMCGYSGMGYEIVDLSEDYVEFDYGEVLGKHLAGRLWYQSDYRISFAKNKTHWQCYYTACIKNVYGCLPEWDKMKQYHGRGIEFFEAAVLIADKIPTHFGFLDAWTSGDGLTGHVRDGRPNQTQAFLASKNIFALDWVAGEKMQINPVNNDVIKEALDRWGTIKISRIGDMTPWHPWANVRPIVISMLDFFEEWYWLSRIMSRMMASRMDKRFAPVSRLQWFFGTIQALVRMIESLGTTSTKPISQKAAVFDM